MTTGNGGVVGTAGKLLGTLPPAFLLLTLLNIAFIGFLMWFLEDQLSARDAMAEKLFNRCLETVLDKAP